MSDVHIAALSLYPVKGCRGLALSQADVLDTGLATAGLRDREWMIVDRNGQFLTQREHPRLALVRVTAADGALRFGAPGMEPLIVGPSAQAADARDVTVWRSQVRGIDQGDAAAAWLATFLAADLRLVRFDRSTPRPCNPDFVGDSGAHTFFADGYPILVIGAASLDDLNGRLARKGEPAVPMNRFRPNVVIAGLPAHDEDHLDTIAFDGVTLRMVKPCARCTVTTVDQATGSVGIEPLPTLSAYRRNDALDGVTFGMNAIVVSGAGRTIAVGASARVEYRF